MKNFVRLLSLALVLGLAGFQSGCSSHHSTARRAGNGSNFEIVETSAKRPLTAAEMALLKVSVAEYLESKGATAKGDYYVKVFLGPDQDGVPADWVIVRFTRNTDLRFSMVASYPTYSPSYYASYDYYPYGYDHYSRISFQYYPDPYYGSSYYFPPGRHHRHYDKDHDHGGGRNRDRDKDRDGDRDHDKDHANTSNRGRFKPIDPVGAPSQVNGNRGDGYASTRSHQPRHDNTTAPDRQPAANRGSGGYATRSDMHRRDRDSTPRSAPASYQPPPSRSESQDRGSSSSSSSSSSNSSSYSPPSYSPPPSYSRSESSSSSTSNSHQSQRNEKPAALRERLE